MNKLLLIIAACCFVFTGVAQEEKSYKMYDFVLLKPDNKHLADLGEAMAKHNREYHSEAPYTAHIWAIQSGTYTGWWAWIMGPCTYTQLDGRPETEAHTKDWTTNVMPYISKTAQANYWKLDDELSFSPEDSFTGKEIWAVFDIKPFEGYRFKEMLKQVKKVYEEKAYTNAFEVYNARFDSKDMGGVLIASSFKNWAFFDEDRNFKKDYEEVHGEGSWWTFMEEYKDVVVSVDDLVAEYLPALSGGTEENK